jgi:hypothetical protein
MLWISGVETRTPAGAEISTHWNDDSGKDNPSKRQGYRFCDYGEKSATWAAGPDSPLPKCTESGPDGVLVTS